MCGMKAKTPANHTKVAKGALARTASRSDKTNTSEWFCPKNRQTIMIKKIRNQVKSRWWKLIQALEKSSTLVNIYFSSSICSPNQASNIIWFLFFPDCFKKFSKNNFSFSNNSEVEIRILLKSFDWFGCNMDSSKYGYNTRLMFLNSLCYLGWSWNHYGHSSKSDYIGFEILNFV